MQWETCTELIIKTVNFHTWKHT